jgi:2-polyprenyl-6-methoxyphenol hydroxylase-like FAD-dependent oxidoreductase
MAQRNSSRVVIVGGGIAGPALGIFLRRVGFDVVLYERRSSEAVDEGLFLGVAPNGMNVLVDLDMHTAVEKISVPCRGFEFQNACGHVIGTIDRANDEARFGARLQMVRRADLHRVLTDRARAAGVEVHFGHTLTEIDHSDPASVVARFADGASDRGDILIGCDGIRSTVRRLTVPEAPQPAYSGLLDFGGITDNPSLPIPIGVNVMVFGRRAFFGAFKTPNGQVWWFHNSGAKQFEIMRREASALRGHVLSLHQDDPSWIGDVIAATERVVGPFPLNDILFMPRGHAGRVCLIGDAAHATTPSAGQGASLALEDAMVLAQCIRDINVPEEAFAAFERARRSRVETIVKQSRRNGSSKAVSGPMQAWLRDRVLPLFLRLGAKWQERQYAFRIDWQQRYA